LRDEALKAEKSIMAFEMGKKEFETLLEAAKKEKEKDEKEKAELAEQHKAAKNDKEKDEKEKKEKAEKIEKLEKELAELKAAQQTAERQSILLQEGINAKDVEAFVKTYASFNDEQFKAVAATTIRTYRTEAALEQLKEKGKITAADLESMKPETVDAKDKDDKEKDKDKDKSKSKASGLFGALASALPKVK